MPSLASPTNSARPSSDHATAVTEPGRVTVATRRNGRSAKVLISVPLKTARYRVSGEKAPQTTFPALRIGLSTPPFGTTQRGRFRERGRWSFLDVDDRERTVVLYLTGHEYRRVVLTVDDPEALIEKLRARIPERG